MFIIYSLYSFIKKIFIECKFKFIACFKYYASFFFKKNYTSYLSNDNFFHVLLQLQL